MFSFFNGPTEIVGKDKLDNGIIVSTVLTPDEGYETAILDDAGTYPVERYDGREGAESGHRKWMVDGALLGNGDTIMMLGWLSLIGEEEVTIVLENS